ncbi:hypothetical protein HanIR_Chr01g0011561 [Helianthus annuus]|nr:hypothetical protein HanIR_Chr01g0011561 [Helianthus annuus]
MSQALNFHASTICSESYYFKLTHIIKKILHSNIFPTNTYCGFELGVLSLLTFLGTFVNI